MLAPKARDRDLLNERFVTYVASSEITSLKHELWDDSVELRTFVTFACFFLAQLNEVFSRLGYYIVVQVEVDSAGLFCLFVCSMELWSVIFSSHV